MWSRSTTATDTGDVAAAGARELARHLLLEHAPRDQPGQRIGQSQRLDARPQARMLDRDRGLRGDQPQNTGCRLREHVDRLLPDDDQHAADVAVAQHRLEDSAPSARRLDQRRRQRGVVAGVGDEVRLLGRERLPATNTLAARLDGDRLDRDTGHRGRREIAARRLQKEGDRSVHHLARRLADGLAGIVAGSQSLGHPSDRAHSLGLISKHVVEPAQISCVGLSFKLGREDSREHHKQLLIGSRVSVSAPRQRGQRPDPGAVGQLQRHAEVRPGGDPLLHPQAGVDVVRADVAAPARATALGHVRAERVAQRKGLIGAQPVVGAAADIHDPVDELTAIQVRQKQRRAAHMALQKVKDGARRVGERPIRCRGGGSCRPDRAYIHVRNHRQKSGVSKAGHPSS